MLGCKREMAAERIALVGIDGGGKSTLARGLVLGLRARGRRTAHLVCPAYHLSSDCEAAPLTDLRLAELSRALERLSSFADERAARALKGLAMFLQMRLYGPVESALAGARPEVVLAERHAVVDALAYAPLYLRGGADGPSAAPARIFAEAREAVDLAAGSGAFERLALFAGGAPGLAALPGDLGRLFAPKDGLIDRLEAAFGTAVPGRILFLDPDPGAAIRAVAGRRGAPAELHETEADLAALRSHYVAALDAIAEARPDVAVERLAAAPDPVALAARL